MSILVKCAILTGLLFIGIVACVILYKRNKSN